MQRRYKLTYSYNTGLKHELSQKTAKHCKFTDIKYDEENWIIRLSCDTVGRSQDVILA